MRNFKVNMTEFKKYDTEWVDELPETCSKCGEPTVDNSFTSKKGERWESVKCEGCATKWMKSKPKGQTSGGSEEVLNACRKIYTKLEEIEKLVKLGE